MSKQEKEEYYQFINVMVLKSLIRNNRGYLGSKSARLRIYRDYLLINSKRKTEKRILKKQEEVLFTNPSLAGSRKLALSKNN